MRIHNYAGRTGCLLVLSLLLYAAYSPFFPGSCHAEDLLEIPGSGDSQSLLRMFAQDFMKNQPDIVVDIPDSIGSTGGIKGLLNKRYELIRTARPLKDHEQNGTLIEYPFAICPVAFALHPSVTGITNLTSSQIVAIYTGAITSWEQLGGPAAPIYPVDREPGDSSRTIIEKRMEGFARAKSVAKIFYTTPETKETLRQHKFTIGFLPKCLAEEMHLTIVSIDGFEPNTANIHDGSYPYFSTFSLVAREPVSESSKQFIRYIYSSNAAKIMKQCGLIRLDKNR